MNANYPQPDPNQPWRYPDPVPVKPTKKRWPWIVGGTIAALVVVGSCSAAIAPAPTPPLSDTASSARSVPGASGPHPLSPVETPTVAEQIPAPPVPDEVVPDSPGSYTAGVYEVPADMPAGKYKTTGPTGSGFSSHCYWERASDASGEFDSLISNDIVEGPGIVTVNTGEVVTFSGSCEWTVQ